MVGASANKEENGYKVFKKLKDAGYQVFPVNPNCEQCPVYGGTGVCQTCEGDGLINSILIK